MSTPESYSSPEIESPTVSLTLGEATYILTWHNTLVRRFRTGGGEYDHLLHQLPDGKYLFIFLDGEDGIDLARQLEKAEYPVRTDPILDEDTIDVYVRKQTSNLEEELSGDDIA